MTPDKVEAALGGLDSILCWWAMFSAQEELAGEPIPDSAVILHFMGSGASTQVTASDFRRLSVLTEALGERERDAARYRFVRDGKSRGMVDLCITEVTWGDPEEHEILTDTKADTAIDAAMKETP